MLKATLRTIGLLIAIVACVSLTYAQDTGGGDSGFFIESMAPESVAPGGVDDASSGLISNVNEYEFDLDLPSGISLHRNFNRREVDARDLIFNTAIAEEVSTGATLTLGARTSMSFTRDESALADVFNQLQQAESTTTMSLSQGFGGGASSGQFMLARTMRDEQTEEGDELSTLTQSFGLETGLGLGMQFSGSYHTSESQESASRLQEVGYGANLTMALSGGEGRAHFDYLQRLVEGRRTDSRQIDLVAPFAVEGGTLTAEHHLSETIIGSHEKIDRSTSLVMPLDMVLDGATASYLETAEIRGDNRKIDRETSFVVPLDIIYEGARASYVEITKIRGDDHEEKNILDLVAPFRMFGQDATFEHQQSELVKNDDVTEERVMRLTADFDGSKAIVERTEMVESSGEDLEHRARLRMQTPDIDLTEWASLSAHQVRDEVEGEETSRVSRVDLSVSPLDPLEVHAIYTRHERPGQETRDDHDIKTALSLSQSAMLKGSIEEQEKVEGSPSVVRHLELTKKAGDTGLDMRFGYSSFGAQEAEQAGGDMLAQLNWGAGSDIGVSAFYTEFDEKKKKPLADPSTTLEFRAGDPAELGFRAGYTSNAGRAEPERSLGLATAAFGGSLKLDYIRNSLDPRGKEVMLSDIYELSFKRQVMGSVSMDFGYRYFTPRAGEALDSDQFYRLQLDGGNVNGGGQIALKFLSGHFVPYPKRGEPPASILDLSYEKRWPEDEGRLTLSLAREEAPKLSVGVEDSFEAEVKYETIF